jgi:hypothetical protein
MSDRQISHVLLFAEYRPKKMSDMSVKQGGGTIWGCEPVRQFILTFHETLLIMDTSFT